MTAAVRTGCRLGDEAGEPPPRPRDGGKETRCFLSPRRKCGLFVVAIPVCLGGSLLLILLTLCGLPALMLAAVGMYGVELRRVVFAPAVPAPSTTGDREGLRAVGKGITGEDALERTGDDSAEEMGRATSGPVTGGEGGGVVPTVTRGEGGGVGSFVPFLFVAIISAGKADMVAETRRLASASRSSCVGDGLTGAVVSLVTCLDDCGLTTNAMGGAVVLGALSTFAVGKKEPFIMEADTRRLVSSSS